jgi:RimJ/RimL family protein N-acetyltransferase
MINELEPSQFERVRPLFRGLSYHLAIFSTIEGNSPGRIWVDHPRHPQTALVWDMVEGGFYLAGFEGDDEVNQALNRCIRQQIYPAARQLPHTLDFVMNYFPDTWESKFDVVLRDTAPMKHYRQHFTFKQLKVDWKSQLSPGFVMTQVDENLLARTGLKNMDHVSRWVLGSWQSVDNFMEKGFGFCLLYGDDAIASWCIADYVAGKAYEMGIHTDEDYRRRGLATLTVAAAVEYCLARGATEIGWHCWSSNVASAATARKVGFEQTIEHPVYHAWYNRFDNLLVQGRFNLEYGRYGAAAQAYEAAFALRDRGDEDALASHIYADGELERWCHYDTACAWALTGDSQAAFRNLKKAVERGWDDMDFLERDERLKSLRETEEWRSLISHLSQLKGEKS